ncbi:MAG: carbohydrate ABC transporter permease, partial [Actinomycetota bacterium]
MIKLFASRTLFQSVLIMNSLIVLLPVFFLINSSLRESNEFARTPFALARDPFWENYQRVWSEGEFGSYFINSLVITGGSLILILILALGAGFVLGRYSFKGNNVIFAF